MRKHIAILVCPFVILVLIVLLPRYSLAQDILSGQNFIVALSKLRENTSTLRMLTSDLADTFENPESPNFVFIAYSVAELEAALVRCEYEIYLMDLIKLIKGDLKPFYIDHRIGCLKILPGFLILCIQRLENNDTMIKKEESLRLSDKAKEHIKVSIGLVEEIIEVLESVKRLKICKK